MVTVVTSWFHSGVQILASMNLNQIELICLERPLSLTCIIPAKGNKVGGNSKRH